MIEYKEGDIVYHILLDSPIIVICTVSDGLVECRYVDNNGIFQRQFFLKC